MADASRRPLRIGGQDWGWALLPSTDPRFIGPLSGRVEGPCRDGASVHELPQRSR